MAGRNRHAIEFSMSKIVTQDANKMFVYLTRRNLRQFKDFNQARGYLTDGYTEHKRNIGLFKLNQITDQEKKISEMMTLKLCEIERIGE